MVVALSPAEIGKVVRQVRKEQKITQVQLAQLTNVGYRFVLDFEAGKETLQIGKAMKVLETLGIRLHLDPPRGSEVKND